ncbi:rhodanese-like domain-containing protein [Gilvimarinus japonicus]|uniref:Rhodanese-like domain-containing protein n=1 Tax=Gilvimarinus japonicus TaxID=1796469 RepID=A0ABV7HPQ0_9GAMM
MNHKTATAQEFLNQHPDCCVLDVRTPAEVAGNHVPGSIFIPVQEITAERVKSEMAAQGQQGKPIYLMCQSGKRAEMAANNLAGKVDEPLIIVTGGVNALSQHDNAPLQKGDSNVISLERQVRIAAGSLVLIGVVLGALVTPVFYALSGFVGAGLVFAGITDTCAMGMLIARMSWNRRH